MFPLVTIALLVAGMVWGQQNQSPADTPLAVSKILVSAQDPAAGVSFVLTNRSAKKIMAYALIVDCPEGCRATKIAIKGLHPAAPPLKDSYYPGTSWQDRIRIPTKALSAPTVSVDYVLFEDGSSWGSDTAKMSLAIEGRQEGFRLARSMLKQLLETKGAQAVLDDLKY